MIPLVFRVVAAVSGFQPGSPAATYPIQSPIRIRRDPATVLVADTGLLRGDRFERMAVRMGWTALPDRPGCFEHRDLGLEVWTACVELEVHSDRSEDRELRVWRPGGDTTTRVPRGRAWGEWGWSTEAGWGGNSYDSPALSGFLLEAWKQEVGGGKGPPASFRATPRSAPELLGRLALSSGWALDYLATDNPFLLDRPEARPAARIVGWGADVLLWAPAIFVASVVPDRSLSERVRIAGIGIGIGAVVRLSLAGWPMAAELSFRNALAESPYPWPRSEPPRDDEP